MNRRSSLLVKCLTAVLSLGTLAYLALHFQPHSPAPEKPAALSPRTERPVELPTPAQDVFGKALREESRKWNAREEKHLSELRELTTGELADLFRTLIPQKDDSEAEYRRNLILQILGERSAAETAFALVAGWNQAHPSVNAPSADDAPVADDITFDEEDYGSTGQGLLAQFYRYYPVAPAVLITELRSFPDPDDRRQILEGYAAFGSHEPDAPATFERLRALLEFSADASGDGLHLTPGEREVIVRQQNIFFGSQIFFLFPIHSDEAPEAEVFRTVALNRERLAALTPLLSEDEQSTMRTTMARELISRQPYLSWDIAATGPTLQGNESSLLSSMLDADTDRAVTAFSTATSYQSDLVAAAFPVDGEEADPLGIRFAPEQLNATAISLFNAALSRNDPDRARQWLERITDSTAHAVAEKKLPLQ